VHHFARGRHVPDKELARSTPVLPNPHGGTTALTFRNTAWAKPQQIAENTPFS
jgi:hypothetical protein